MQLKQYKVRRLTKGNSTGDVIGITLPGYIRYEFLGVSFSVHVSGTTIFLESGCKPEVYLEAVSSHD